MNTPFISPESIQKRNLIIAEHRRVILEMRRIEKEISVVLAEATPRWRELEVERNQFYLQLEPIIQKYWDWIPAVPLSRCPFCEKELTRLFDPIDLKGFWWMDRIQRTRPEPEACEHFCLLLGAVNFNGLPPEGGVFDAYLGPEVPFVIPRILELPTMETVVSKIDMHCGYSAYPIAYFSEIKPPFRSLTQSWAKIEYRFEVEGGKTGWDKILDQYDCDGAAWIKKGKVRWIGEGICPEGKGTCPPQILVGNELRYGSGL